MALQSAFRERLDQMEHTRNQRLSLLQSEKELQINKSAVLESKACNIRLLEQRCLKLDCKIASQHLMLSSHRSELHRLDSVYSEIFQKLRTLKNEVEELNEMEKEKESYYESQKQEMENFRAQAVNHMDISQVQVEELKTRANELKLSFLKLQNSLNYSDSSEISAADRKKSELLVQKESLDKILASNYQVREQLKKQLHTILSEHDRERRK
ncbi:OLC1v1015721C1 [Oldenlandia corymbosa var. corymbosa]|uniref:OLC1v1015721C1 n=1 Tax=Oldenlandia corymbosa var. corymbosa TaxID=529605 RepID=A0AAV1E652_OLDCO|nr:OLC1v1015721C1 [Oldenlandia corymbosa var. corymbosa]